MLQIKASDISTISFYISFKSDKYASRYFYNSGLTLFTFLLNQINTRADLFEQVFAASFIFFLNQINTKALFQLLRKPVQVYIPFKSNKY